MNVTDDELKKILDHRKRRDQDAFMIGVATEEWMRHIETIRGRIRRDEEQERFDGEQILRNHGLDPQKGEYRIEPDGKILELLSGEYREVVG